jgi:hypothetical protein
VSFLCSFDPRSRELTITVAEGSEIWTVIPLPSARAAAVELFHRDGSRPSVVCIRDWAGSICTCLEFLLLGACRHLRALHIQGLL